MWTGRSVRVQLPVRYFHAIFAGDFLLHLLDSPPFPQFCALSISFREIGEVIENHADSFGFGVSKIFVGHGIGRDFHCEPDVSLLSSRRNARRTGSLLF